MVSLLRLVSCAALVAASLSSSPEFDAWVERFQKTYSSDEEREQRALVWAANLEKVNRHNAAGKSTKLGMNQFADLTSEEFKEKYRGGSEGRNLRGGPDGPALPPYNETGARMLQSVDWVGSGHINAPINRGYCISGYAQAIVGASEAAMKIKYNFLPQASIQELIDCSSSNGNAGCGGGQAGYAISYVSFWGLASASDYGYTGSTGTCHNYMYGRTLYIDSYASTSSSDSALASSVATRPTVVPINLVNDAIQLYEDGIVTDATECSSLTENWGLVVGYGVDNSVPYFTVRLDFGTSWGESGYVRILRDDTLTYGVCGIYGSLHWVAKT